MSTDLFGVEVSDKTIPCKGFGKPKRRNTQPNGYAWKPGTGPAGEKCKTCRHIARRRMGKVYLKCALTQASWTSGPGSDIKANSPACAKWEAPE